ncbi:MAG: hypothetical protein JXQ29_02085 [Planctomycetes bacterium]|nr:hypothetical protein [Planctomycetota bacterium]
MVAAVFDEGETVELNRTFWTNFFLRDFLLLDPTKQWSPRFRQPSTGIPQERGFILDGAGKVVLAYFSHQPELAIRSLQALQGGGLLCTPAASTISQATGGPLVLSVDGTPIRRGKGYATAITLSGTVPGTVLDGVRVPINMDGLTWVGLLGAGSPLFPEFIGTLDARGRAMPAFAPAPGQIPAPLIGLKLWFAAVTFDGPRLSTSPAAEVTIVP